LLAEAVDRWRAMSGPDGFEDVRDILCRAAAAGPAAVRLASGEAGSPDVAVRAMACALLGVASELHEDVRHDAATVLLAQATVEPDDDVLWSIARGLGATRDDRGLPVLVGLAHHADADVRLQVAVALPSVMGDGIDAEAGVATLIALCSDVDADVRNWATFGLGWQSSADGLVVRQTLWDRTFDSDPEAREEGIRGLARRRDRRAVPLLGELLAEESAYVHTFVAAAFAGDPGLVPLLDHFDPADAGVAEALQGCDPVRRARRDALVLDLLDAVWALLPDRDVSMVGERVELGLELVISSATLDRPAVWWVESLLDRGGGDAAQAARLVVADMGG
jgi:HEAT repeat protein